MRVRPVRTELLLDELATRVEALGRTRARVIVDGAEPTRPDRLADELADELGVRGRPTLRVSARHFLRPASVRLERGREDPDELLTGWLDERGLRREAWDPAGPSGSGLVLPRLWDARADRAFRDRRQPLATDGVLVLDGALLLGRGLPAELTVHLRLTDAALARRLPPEWHWTLPAHRRYAAEHRPEAVADVVVLADDPARLAVLETR